MVYVSDPNAGKGNSGRSLGSLATHPNQMQCPQAIERFCLKKGMWTILKEQLWKINSGLHTHTLTHMYVCTHTHGHPTKAHKHVRIIIKNIMLSPSIVSQLKCYTLLPNA